MIKPIYCELSEKLEDYISKRNLSGRLPGLSLLSKEFGVHQVTMSKAVKLLEKKGLLTINGTRGTFINERPGGRPVHKVIGVIGLSHNRERDNFIAKLGKSIKKSGYTPIGITISEESFAKNPELLSHFPVDGFLFCCSSLTDDIAKQTLGHHRIAYISPATAPEYQHHAKWIHTIIRNSMQDDFDDKLFYNFPLNWQELFQTEKLAPEINRMLHYFASLPEPPTAILAPSETGMEIISQIEKYGLDCPKDISVFFYGTSIHYDKDISYSFFDYDELWLEGIKIILGIFNGSLEQPVSKLLKMPVVPGGTVGKAPVKNKFQTAFNYESIQLLTEFKQASGKQKKQEALAIN
jgi:DNA-binding transcriptional regulator YhcF (GntR family)